jgi:hypothetical protein
MRLQIQHASIKYDTLYLRKILGLYALPRTGAEQAWPLLCEGEQPQLLTTNIIFIRLCRSK